MKAKRLILTGVLLVAFMFVNAYTGDAFKYFTPVKSIQTAYAAEKGFSGHYILAKSSHGTSGGFRSGTFKSSGKSSSGGFKSGGFKSSGNGSNSYKSDGSSKSKSTPSYSPPSSSKRTFIPIPIPWGGFHSYGYGGFHPISSIFTIIIIIFVVYLIIKTINRKKY